MFIESHSLPAQAKIFVWRYKGNRNYPCWNIAANEDCLKGIIEIFSNGGEGDFLISVGVSRATAEILSIPSTRIISKVLQPRSLEIFVRGSEADCGISHLGSSRILRMSLGAAKAGVFLRLCREMLVGLVDEGFDCGEECIYFWRAV